MSTPTNGALMEQTTFLFPDLVVDGDFSQEELAADMDGLQLGFQRIKIPAGGGRRFELPGDDPDNPEEVEFLEGVIVHSHNANARWEEGSEYDDNSAPICQSPDGKLGYGDPGGICASCPCNRFGTGPKGKGKACKNMRVIYLLRSGDYMPIQLALSPTSIRPYTDFVNAAFFSRRRGVCSGLVRIGLKKKSNGKDDYSVATFSKIRDFSGEELAKARAYSESLREQIELLLKQQAIDAETAAGDGVETGPLRMDLQDNGNHFNIGVIDGEHCDLPD